MDEIEDILRELVRLPGVIAAAIGPLDAGTFAAAAERRVPLAEGVELVALLDKDDPDTAAAVDRAGRAVRACARRLGLGALEDVQVVGRAARPRAALVRKMARFLDAFAAAQGAEAVALLRGPEVVAAGGALDEFRRERLPFLRKRLDAEAARGKGRSSHAELVAEDVYACSFWFGAYLIAFFGRPWSIDFVRHRARAVTRELATILPHLDEDPPEPADVRPRPKGPE